MDRFVAEVSIWIHAPIERVWEAVTSADQIMHWWPNEWTIPTLAVGAEISFGWEGHHVTATIAALEPPHLFVIQWPPVPDYNNAAPLTTFRLQSENDGTRVTVSESGLDALPADVRQSLYDQTQQGYQTIMTNLKAWLEPPLS